MATVDWLDPDSLDFPPLAAALTEPNGLLAVGGDLRPERLVNAYRHGIFPWYEDPQPLLWWSPDPRAVLIPDQIHVSRSLAKVLRRAEFRVSFDSAFRRVINACATLDQNRTGTWITSDMMNAYIRMFELGWAHSVEVWRDRELVGGLYGIGMGKVFFGESMFSRESNASKVALVSLGEKLRHLEVELIDCQVGNPHLYRMGAIDISRAEFAFRLARLADASQQNWRLAEAR